MKKLVLAFYFLLNATLILAQSDSEISGVYIKRAERHLEKIEYKEALAEFNKAMKYADTITQPNVAWLGTYINFELKNYREARKYAKQYFSLKPNKKSEEYEDLLEVYVNIEEKIQKQIEEENRIEQERIRKEKEKRRLDSLENVWKTKSEELSLKVNKIFDFNKYGTALYSNNGAYGIINDIGEILLEAKDYKAIKSFDGYTLFQDTEKNPTQLYAFKHATKVGFLLPSPSQFNSISTHYGAIMLPRNNGRIVAYPNNALKAMVYDMTSKQLIDMPDTKALLKELRKTDKIEKSNKDGQVKVNKEWYNLGSDLGGGIFPLFSNDYNLKGFLCSVDGTFLSNQEYNHIGAFCKGTYEAVKDGKTFWVNQNGTKVNAPTDTFGTYPGKTKIIQLKEGVYQLKQADVVILKDQKLENLQEFLKNNSPK